MAPASLLRLIEEAAALLLLLLLLLLLCTKTTQHDGGVTVQACAETRGSAIFSAMGTADCCKQKELAVQQRVYPSACREYERDVEGD